MTPVSAPWSVLLKRYLFICPSGDTIDDTRGDTADGCIDKTTDVTERNIGDIFGYNSCDETDSDSGN